MVRERNIGIAYLLWLLLGILGAHKLYLRRPWMALLYLCTAGLFLIGWIVDLFTMGEQVDACNEDIFEGDDTDFLEDRIDELEDLVEELQDQLHDQ
jgi:TM2 domain-containing membrane protein YozV